ASGAIVDHEEFAAFGFDNITKGGEGFFAQRLDDQCAHVGLLFLSSLSMLGFCRSGHARSYRLCIYLATLPNRRRRLMPPSGNTFTRTWVIGPSALICSLNSCSACIE